MGYNPQENQSFHTFSSPRLCSERRPPSNVENFHWGCGWGLVPSYQRFFWSKPDLFFPTTELRTIQTKVKQHQSLGESWWIHREINFSKWYSLWYILMRRLRLNPFLPTSLTQLIDFRDCGRICWNESWHNGWDWVMLERKFCIISGTPSVYIYIYTYIHRLSCV